MTFFLVLITYGIIAKSGEKSNKNDQKDKIQGSAVCSMKNPSCSRMSV